MVLGHKVLLVYAGYGLGFRFVALVYVTDSKFKQVIRLDAVFVCLRLQRV